MHFVKPDCGNCPTAFQGYFSYKWLSIIYLFSIFPYKYDCFFLCSWFLQLSLCTVIMMRGGGVVVKRRVSSFWTFSTLISSIAKTLLRLCWVVFFLILIESNHKLMLHKIWFHMYYFFLLLPIAVLLLSER